MSFTRKYRWATDGDIGGHRSYCTNPATHPPREWCTAGADSADKSPAYIEDHPDTDTFEGFMQVYGDPSRIKCEVDLLETYQDELSPFLVIHAGSDTYVLNPMLFKDHSCIDVHVFTDGKRSKAGVFGMTAGSRFTFDNTGDTSHGWPAASLVTILMGEQVRT